MAASENTDDLKTTLALARRNPLSFGLCFGKKPETTVLMTHKTKAPSVMGQQARKAGETGKFTFGTMSVNGKILELRCEGDAPAGAGRKIKEYLKSAGIAMRVVLLDMTGNVLDGDDDSDAEKPEAGDGAAPEIPAQTGPDAEPDPRLAEWEQTSAELASAIDTATGASPATLADLRKNLKMLDDLAAGGEPDKALAGAASITEGLKKTVEAAQIAKDDQQRWEDARVKIQPIIEQTLESGAGNSRKIEALWAFAVAKVEAAEPDYAAAIKTISMLVKLIGEARAAAPSEAPEMAEASATATASPPPPSAPEPAADGPPAPEGDGQLATADATPRRAQTQGRLPPRPPPRRPREAHRTLPHPQIWAARLMNGSRGQNPGLLPWIR